MSAVSPRPGKMVADVWRRALMAGQDGGCLGTQALTPGVVSWSHVVALYPE